MIKKLCLACCLGLAACRAPLTEPFTVIDYRQEEPIYLAADVVEVSDQTIRYPDLPHLETRIPIAPAKALKEALMNRFQAARDQSGNSFSVTVQTASLTQKTQKSEHWYILDNVEYLLEYEVIVRYNRSGYPVETQQIIGWEKQALPRRSSLAEKEDAWQKMINAMIQKTVDKIQTDMPPSLQL
ncbi:MAG: hypothetical protein IJV07_01940 [Alphaproteobacteria bacterium]|nr:hypothetical protein [Alphaproteobacteria bacterium]